MEVCPIVFQWMGWYGVKGPYERRTCERAFVHLQTYPLGWAENACFFIKFRILQTLGEILLLHRKKEYCPNFI